jgi:hypothetical protein
MAECVEPGRLQTFSFESCVDLVWKLDWEITRLLHATPHDIIDMKCFAFNAAVTAWQLADWVFEDMTIEERTKRGISTLPELQKLARQECHALHLCQRVAVASKHRVVRFHHDPAITTAVRAIAVASGRFGKWELLIVDGETSYAAYDVFEEARQYWYKFICGLGLIL